MYYAHGGRKLTNTRGKFGDFSSGRCYLTHCCALPSHNIYIIYTVYTVHTFWMCSLAPISYPFPTHHHYPVYIPVLRPVYLHHMHITHLTNLYLLLNIKITPFTHSPASKFGMPIISTYPPPSPYHSFSLHLVYERKLFLWYTYGLYNFTVENFIATFFNNVNYQIETNCLGHFIPYTPSPKPIPKNSIQRLTKDR